MSDPAATAADAFFCMPALGADMVEGKVLAWYAQPGQTVHRGDVVALIDTEKAEIEAEIWVDAVMGEPLVALGEVVPIGAPLARLSQPGETAKPLPLPLATAAPAASPMVAAAAQTTTSPLPHHPPTYSPLARHDAERQGVDLEHLHGSGRGGAVTRADVAALVAPASASGAPATTRRSSPFARRLAAAAGIDLDELSGSGPGGAVIAVDVVPGPAVQPAEPTPPPPPPQTATGSPAGPPASRTRRAVAALMARSKREIPHFYLALDIDLTATLADLTARNEARPPGQRILPAAALLRATALAARDVPALNGYFVDDAFQPADGVHLGVAVSLRGGGLVAPAIRDADRLSLEELMERLRDLVARARKGTLRASEMASPTITVTNLGEGGADAVYAVIYPPQVAMVGFGAIRERPWAQGGMVGARQVVTATVAADHRANDGHVAARFLAAIASHLANPEP